MTLFRVEARPRVCPMPTRYMLVRTVLAGSLLWTGVAQALTLPELLSAMSALPEQRAEFDEQKHLAMLDKPLHASGTLLYRRPDFLEQRTNPPADEIMTVAGDRLTITWPSRQERRTLSLSANPVAWAFVESIRATLAGDRAALERFYWVTLSGEMSHWSLTLEPRASGVASYVKSITLSGKGSSIEQVDVLEANGDRSLMDIKSLSEQGPNQTPNQTHRTP
jgi:hypothetical protein